MAEEEKQTEPEKKEKIKEGKLEKKVAEDVEKKEGKKVGEKKELKKKVKKEKPEPVKKDKAIVRGKDLPISTKHSVAICNFIRGKDVIKAAENLRQVVEKKEAIKMKGEVPHRRGKGAEGGRYPIEASKVFIKLLKSLVANCNMGNIENPYIITAKANQASRPYKRFGSRRMKRTHVYLEARERKIKGKEVEEERKIKEEKKAGKVKK